MSNSDFKGQIVVYSIVGCPFCMRAKQTLRDLELPFLDINLDSYGESVRKEVRERSGRSTVPQIFFNSKHVGGYDDLKALLADKVGLDRLIEEVKNNESPPEAPKVPDSSELKKEKIGDMDFTCELDEHAVLIRDLKMSGIIKDHRKGLTTHKNTFQANQFVDWLVKEKSFDDRATGIVSGQDLLDRGYAAAVKATRDGRFEDNDTLYRLLEHDQNSALNAGLTSECEARPASDLGEDLRKLILSLYNDFLTPDGKSVNYKGIAESSQFKMYTRMTAQLYRVDIKSATREEKIAFFINIYNALVIHGYVAVGAPTNLWQRYKFFNYVSYIIGGQLYSLNDIENGVLRANRKPIGSLSKPFSKSDLRLVVALDQPEPLIHFALVCGAKSCPPIKTYSGKDVMNELKLAAEAFLEGSDGCQVNADKKEVKCSQIFKWYREDFGKNDKDVAVFISNHMGPGEKKTSFLQVISQKDYKVSYMKYNWAINSQ
ncbi:uncharacterized protein LOC593247 [Strongylocentrotus purpuratus]|uniref:DEP domain-containing protein n=1 Tax=Strongylocentrotus purpuratus TaxID=7668 RepID=A0A7M7T108_STRPU|nr:uncharacterized protein LOC593247 [Strongylocentrotus purpuratus]